MIACKSFARLMLNDNKIVLVCQRCAWTEELPEVATLEQLMLAEVHHFGYERAGV